MGGFRIERTALRLETTGDNMVNLASSPQDRKLDVADPPYVSFPRFEATVEFLRQGLIGEISADALELAFPDDSESNRSGLRSELRRAFEALDLADSPEAEFLLGRLVRATDRGPIYLQLVSSYYPITLEAARGGATRPQLCRILARPNRSDSTTSRAVTFFMALGVAAGLDLRIPRTRERGGQTTSAYTNRDSVAGAALASPPPSSDPEDESAVAQASGLGVSILDQEYAALLIRGMETALEKDSDLDHLRVFEGLAEKFERMRGASQ